MTQNFYTAFLALPTAITPGEFRAIPLSKTRKDFLAKNEDGAPIFLLHDSSNSKYSPNINFRYLTAQFHVTCSINTDVANIQDQFCIVCCENATPDLHELFIRSIGSAIHGLPENCDTSELEMLITSLKDLFRALTKPSNLEVSGLWAELYVIARSGNILEAMTLWHQDKFDRFDFSSNCIHLEIKSTVRGLRVHEFALEQLEPPLSGAGFLISMILQPLSGGVSVLDLAKAIEIEISQAQNLRQKLWENITKVLGSDFSEKLDRCFDPAFAERNLIIFSMSDIPKPLIPVDPRITAIRFVSDLSSVTSTLATPSHLGISQLF